MYTRHNELAQRLDQGFTLQADVEDGLIVGTHNVECWVSGVEAKPQTRYALAFEEQELDYRLRTGYPNLSSELQRELKQRHSKLCREIEEAWCLADDQTKREEVEKRYWNGMWHLNDLLDRYCERTGYSQRWERFLQKEYY